MLNKKQIKKILKKGKPKPKNIIWWGEPELGGWYTDIEIKAVVKSIKESMNWLIGFDPKSLKTVKKFENFFAQYCGSKHAISTNSCGTAIDMAMSVLNLKKGDEIICPAVNYKAAHLSIIKQGGKVVFCEINPKTLNIDPADVEKRITKKTRAIFSVSLTGIPAPIDDLLDVAKRHSYSKNNSIKVIDDAARACGALYKGSRVGSKAWMTLFSFQSQKLMTTLGEGGMITTNDKILANRLYDIRAFGGENNWGSNYRMTKVQAAVGLIQLKRLNKMNYYRKKAAQRRSRLLDDVPEIILPYKPVDSEHVYYLYSILVRSDWAGKKRDKIISIMQKKFGIACSLSNPPTYKRWPYIALKCGKPKLKISEDIGKRIFSPPLHPLLTEDQELYICASLLESINLIKHGY